MKQANTSADGAEQNTKFKKFWVKSVNNWLCAADYSGKRLKENNPTPSFREFTFIKRWDDLKYFRKHEGHENRELVEGWLKQIAIAEAEKED